jgi:hypothetical protein
VSRGWGGLGGWRVYTAWVVCAAWVVCLAWVACIHRVGVAFGLFLVFIGLWEGVSTDFLKFHLSPSCLTLLRPAGWPPPKCLTVISGMSRPLRRRLVAVSFPFGHPPPCAYGVWRGLFLVFPFSILFVSLTLIDENSGPGAGAGIGVRSGVSKRVEDCCRLPALWAGHPQNGCRAFRG